MGARVRLFRARTRLLVFSAGSMFKFAGDIIDGLPVVIDEVFFPLNVNYCLRYSNEVRKMPIQYEIVQLFFARCK